MTDDNVTCRGCRKRLERQDLGDDERVLCYDCYELEPKELRIVQLKALVLDYRSFFLTVRDAMESYVAEGGGVAPAASFYHDVSCAYSSYKPILEGE